MGTANKIPGVSGGAVAYVLNFYDELIFSLSKFNFKAFNLLFNKGFKVFYKHINGSFLLCVLTGILFSFFTISKLLDYFLFHFEIQVWALFFGLIIGSALYLINKYNHWNLRAYVLLIIGLAIGLGVNYIQIGQENHNLWFVFLCGIISVCGITIPGLSGSYILMLMGNYVFLLVKNVNTLGSILSSLLLGDFKVLEITENQECLSVLLSFLAGSISGLIIFAQLLGYALKKHQKTVTVIIIGFIIGSLGTVWPWKHKVYNGDVVVEFQKYLPNLKHQNNLLALLFIVFGVFLVLGLEKYAKK